MRIKKLIHLTISPKEAKQLLKDLADVTGLQSRPGLFELERLLARSVSA